MNEERIKQAKLMVLDGALPDMAAVRRLSSTEVNDLCPCGSQKKYKRCHQDADKASDQVMRKIEGIENGVKILDGAEQAIAEGKQGLCKLPGSGTSDYKSDKYLCDQWSAASGASVARAGQKPDMLPEELKDRHGDGNDN